MTIANDALGSGFADFLRPALANLLSVAFTSKAAGAPSVWLAPVAYAPRRRHRAALVAATSCPHQAEADQPVQHLDHLSRPEVGSWMGREPLSRVDVHHGQDAD
jgi:hypothetical protein